MLKLEDVAMSMQPNFKEVNFLFPEKFLGDIFLEQNANEPFCDSVVDFLNALSKELNKDSNIRAFPDVATFAFFCRRANILKLKNQYEKTDIIRLGRGVVFHIAPSNVPVNFAYSLIAGLLAGNVNIVRVPSKDFEQVVMIVEAIKRLEKTSKHSAILQKISLVRYDRQNSATSYFSSICDVRIIWGGDETISQIRKSSLMARAFDITFADRYSFCVINADEFINEDYPEKIARGFYNDTYLFDQNACSAPHLVTWLGKETNVTQAKMIFWTKLQEIVDEKYKLQSVMAVDKLSSFYAQAIKLEQLQKVNTLNNSLWRVNLDSLPKNIDGFRCAGGYFSEYSANNIYEIAKVINRKYQTMAYYGIDNEELKLFMHETKPSGIDRIVPIGRTTDFSLNWDGFNLIRALTRVIEIT